MKCKHCDEKAEWLDKYCQEHWEAYCEDEWLRMMVELSEVLSGEWKG